jgi:site-specific DNA recombinase
MDNIETSAQLLALLRANQPKSAEELDTSTVRYALYTRKSTTDEERQERSTEDQLRDCMERVVVPDKLHLAQDPIQENYSAKEPDVRPKFRRLIEDIKSGRITGVIAWHPDRLARNMKEAGEIIDLLDKGTLKDLRFATSTFENNPTGKMLLGISFVLSKQYSEHLSESVTRGNKRTTEDGVYIGKMKHGYYVNEDRNLFPDGENFLIIRQAFQMRLDGATQPEIVEWLNSTSYQVRWHGKDPKRVKWDKDMVSKMLKDPVYAGVMKYGKHLVDLTDKYAFEPVVTVKEFFKLNKISSLDSTKLVSSMTVKGGEIRANLLRGVVVCGHCNRPFSSGLTSKLLKSGPIHYYNYKCETEDCLFRNKSVRAKVVLEYARDFFREYMFITKDNYDQYVTDAKTEIAARTKVINSEIASLSKSSGDKEKEYEESKDFVRSNPILAKHYDLDKLKAEVDTLKSKLEDRKEQRSSIKNSIFTYEKYLELFQNISVILGDMNDMDQMDGVLRKFFSNFTVTDLGRDAEQRYKITYYLNEPWLGFIKNDNVVHGRGERTRTFDLTVPNRARYQLRHTPMVLPE